MQIKSDSGVMNLTDTNGRRSDLIVSYNDYLGILKQQNEQSLKWDSFPKSLAQYRFYTNAVNKAAHVFTNTSKLDSFNAELDKLNLREAFMCCDSASMKSTYEGAALLKSYLNNIEPRARHYTNSLVKIGFIDDRRNVSSSGIAFFNGSDIPNTDFERLLGINGNQLTLLRQVLKLRVWNSDGTQYYSPFSAFIHVVMKSKLPMIDVARVVTCINPAHRIDESIFGNITDSVRFIDEYNKNIFNEEDNYDFPSNGKSKLTNTVYIDFVNACISFAIDSSETSFKKLMDIYLPNKMTLAKMFNYGNAIFNISGNASNHMSTFIDKNKSSDFILIIDRFWYINRAWSSKRYDQIREYAGELIKIINATGIGTCSNGIFSLAIEPIWKTLLSDGKLPIFGYGELNEYENGIDSIFRSNSTIDDILHLDMLNISDIRKSINNYGGIEYLKEQKQNLNEQILRNLAVQRFTPKRLCTLLEKCGNRTPESDRELISIMGGYSDVPTIYEYLIAMAMFHLSNQKMHIANSINMNITSDGLPLRFAGGWQADIVIDIDNRITIVEVTLMDSRAQEKGEMPSVIRHTISNIEAYSNKSVNTIFIAPTINPMIASIWKSLRSSEIKDEHGELVKKQVIIDTITNNELIHKLETL